MKNLSDTLGVCQWFHYQDSTSVRQTVTLLRELGVQHLRMDVSWADYHRDGGKEWYRWLFETLAEFQLLACVWHTPPSISQNGNSNGPPQNLQWFSEFIWELLEHYPKSFSALELWNEPNNWLKWDHASDPHWEQFSAMIASAAEVCKQYRVPAVLGGMSPINGGWLDFLKMHKQTVLVNIAGIGVHAFPGQWNEKNLWEGWNGVIKHLNEHADNRPLWITEVGASTTTGGGISMDSQVERLHEVAAIAHKVERIYWYSLLDLPQDKDEIEKTIGGYPEPLEHSLGLVTEHGEKKPAFFELQKLLQRKQEAA